jgi:hypothetical protein
MKQQESKVTTEEAIRQMRDQDAVGEGILTEMEMAALDSCAVSSGDINAYNAWVALCLYRKPESTAAAKDHLRKMVQLWRKAQQAEQEPKSKQEPESETEFTGARRFSLREMASVKRNHFKWTDEQAAEHARGCFTCAVSTMIADFADNFKPIEGGPQDIEDVHRDIINSLLYAAVHHAIWLNDCEDPLDLQLVSGATFINLASAWKMYHDTFSRDHKVGEILEVLLNALKKGPPRG